nr:MAG TPA: hypothetical protein [Caudoviricetes sp.]DAT31971.1 MAG TPA: hypothetical protein [Caudoviricetes sp.]DAT61158.1 MAG TPA: hypothetical protein [Caudoviricetes sp.]
MIFLSQFYIFSKIDFFVSLFHFFTFLFLTH